MTKAKQICDFKQANPTASVDGIAVACGVNKTYVYQVLHNAKKKAVKAVKPVASEGQKIVREEVKHLHEEIDKLQTFREMDGEFIAEIRDELDRLNNDIVGYRAVISYLQGQLDGVTV